MPTVVQDAELTPLGYEQFTSFNGAAIDLNVPKGATYALLQAETNDVRWRDDGTDPATTVGVLLVAGDDRLYNGDLGKLRLIAVDGTSILNVSYYK